MCFYYCHIMGLVLLMIVVLCILYSNRELQYVCVPRCACVCVRAHTHTLYVEYWMCIQVSGRDTWRAWEESRCTGALVYSVCCICVRTYSTYVYVHVGLLENNNRENSHRIRPSVILFPLSSHFLFSCSFLVGKTNVP